MAKQFVKSYRRKSGKVVSSYSRNVKKIAKRTTRAIPTDIDDQVLEIMIKSAKKTRKIDDLRKELPSVLAPVGNPERVFQKEKIQKIKVLQRERNALSKQVTALWKDLSQPQKSRVMLSFNEQLDIINA